MLSKNQFIFISYNNLLYPPSYDSNIQEIAGHLDKSIIEPIGIYSLHTEYSYSKRKLSSALISHFPVLQAASKEGVPQLWKSSEWAEEFASFILALTADKNPPKIIEIHPPFNDYCSMDEFAKRFRVFEESIHRTHPTTQIVIENRSGSVYHGGKFLVSKAKEIALLSETIKSQKLKLGIVLDFPQLLTAENIDPLKFKSEKYLSSIEVLSPHRALICGIHIWGKKKSSTGRWVAHCGRNTANLQ